MSIPKLVATAVITVSTLFAASPSAHALSTPEPKPVTVRTVKVPAAVLRPKVIPLTTGQRIAGFIRSHELGKPYVYGAAGPYSFDCSGLMYYSSHKIGVSWMPRTSQDQQSRLSRVAYSNRKIGDFVFFGYPAHHVGIYIGMGWWYGKLVPLMINAPHTGTVVRIEPVFYPGVGSVSFGRP